MTQTSNQPIAVTIITPLYNRARYIHSAIRMLKRQTLTNIQVFLIDDGSQDDSYNILLEEIFQDKRFKILLNSKNKGPSVARNKALKRAKGKYVGFFDIDDEIPTNYFEELYKNAEETNADIVFTNYNNVVHATHSTDEVASHFDLLRNGAIWDKLFRNDFLKKNKIRFAPGLYCADNLFVIQSFFAAKKISLIDKPTYFYSLQTDSIGKDLTKSNKRAKDAVRICKEAVKFANKQHLPFAERLALQSFLRRSFSCYMKDKKVLTNLSIVTWPLGAVYSPAIPRTKYFFWRILSKFHLMTKQQCIEKRYISLIKHSNLFDVAYYRNVCDKKFSSTSKYLRHYLTEGYKKQYNPSPLFDGNRYLRDYPDIANKNINPLLHYILHGSKEGRIYYNLKGNERGGMPMLKPSIKENVHHFFTYPIRVKEEHDRLISEINTLEKMSK